MGASRLLLWPMKSEPILYDIMVRIEPGTNGIRALRALLKVMLRWFGIRCIAVEVAPSYEAKTAKQAMQPKNSVKATKHAKSSKIQRIMASPPVADGLKVPGES